MAQFQFVYPCGHAEVLEATYAYGRRYNGKRPVELNITGDFPSDRYEWQKNVVHPNQGVMTHNGKVII